MADATSTASGLRNMRPTYGEGGGRSSGPRSSFDSNVPAGVDPEGLWRFGNTDKFRRTGTTSAERAGAVPGYTPGYGRASNRNATGGAGSLTPQAQWDAPFTPQLGPQMAQQRNGGNTPASPMQKGAMQTGDTWAKGVTPSISGMPETWDDESKTFIPPTEGYLNGLPNPPAATPSVTPALPVLPPSPGIQQNTGSHSTVRSVTGLPPGQSASATFVPGQNSPQNLAKRTRPPVDPLAV